MQNGFSSIGPSAFDGDPHGQENGGQFPSVPKENTERVPSVSPKDEAERLFHHIHTQALFYLSTALPSSSPWSLDDLPDLSPEGADFSDAFTTVVKESRYALLRGMTLHDIPAFAHHAGMTADVLGHVLASPHLTEKECIALLESPHIQEDLLLRILAHPGATEVVFDLILTHPKSKDSLLVPYIHLRQGDAVFFRALLHTQFFTETTLLRTLSTDWKFTSSEMLPQFLVRFPSAISLTYGLLKNPSLQEEDLMYLIGYANLTGEQLRMIIDHPSFTLALVEQCIASPLFTDTHIFALFTFLEREGLGLSCAHMRALLLHPGVSSLGLRLLIGSDDFSFELLPDILHHPCCEVEHIRALYVRAQQESRKETLKELRSYICAQGIDQEDTYLSLMTGIFYRE